MRSLLVSIAALSGAALVISACSRLTSPPAPEPIASDTPVTAAASMSARPIASGPARHAPPNSSAVPPGPIAPVVDDPNFKIVDLSIGNGAAVQPHDTVTVHYTGTLVDGTKFDSSHDHPGNQPFTTPLDRVIPGWGRGLVGMKIGGHRKLTIPPSMAYGAQAKPGIPPNSTLVFDIDLIDSKSGPPRPPHRPTGP